MKYGSFATDINHHQSEAQDKCIICCHNHDLDNCEEYMKKSIEEKSKFLAWKKLYYSGYKPISMSHNARTCNDRQTCQICKKRNILPAYMVTLQSRKLEMITLMH